MRLALLPTLALTALLFSAGAAQEPPLRTDGDRITRRLTDQTGTLSARESAEIEARLREIEQSTSNQIVVVIVPTTGMEPIEDAALRIAEANGIGRKSKNNGVLLLIAKDDRKIRIEVGYGLEGALPDALAGSIIRNEIAPAFRSGRFFEGIQAGIEAIDRATRGEYAAEPGEEEGGGGQVIILILLLLFYLMRSRFRRRLGGFFPTGFPGLGGGSSGGGWGGGFSGGGGGFGGGGATGRW